MKLLIISVALALSGCSVIGGASLDHTQMMLESFKTECSKHVEIQSTITETSGSSVSEFTLKCGG